MARYELRNLQPDHLRSSNGYTLTPSSGYVGILPLKQRIFDRGMFMWVRRPPLNSSATLKGIYRSGTSSVFTYDTTGANGIYYSTDSGATFTAYSLPTNSGAAGGMPARMATGGGWFCAVSPSAGYTELWYTTAANGTWTKVCAPSIGNTIIHVDAGYNGTNWVYSAFYYGGGILNTTTPASTWSTSTVASFGFSVGVVHRGNYYIAGGHTGTQLGYYSSSGGTTATAITSPFTLGGSVQSITSGAYMTSGQYTAVTSMGEVAYCSVWLGAPTTWTLANYKMNNNLRGVIWQSGGNAVGKWGYFLVTDEGRVLASAFQNYSDTFQANQFIDISPSPGLATSGAAVPYPYNFFPWSYSTSGTDIRVSTTGTNFLTIAHKDGSLSMQSPVVVARGNT